MIKSMTGFGRGEISDGKRNFYIEVKSVNHRYSDITVKIPRRYTFAEDKIKALAKERIIRGKAEIFIAIEGVTEEDLTIKLNRVMAGQYIENLKELQGEFQLTGDITLQYVAGLPEVLRSIPEVDDEEAIMKGLEQALTLAIDSFDTMRVAEGGKLAEDLHGRADLLTKYLGIIKEKAPDISVTYAEKLRVRIGELIHGSVEIPEDRILLEAAIFADKASITEEVVRLESHISQFNDILRSGKPVGKKLDFLVQEMNREANTIGSKANDLEITSTMLEIKSEIEKIREQIQNIE